MSYIIKLPKVQAEWFYEFVTRDLGLSAWLDLNLSCETTEDRTQVRVLASIEDTRAAYDLWNEKFQSVIFGNQAR